MTLFVAILCGFLYFIGSSRLFYGMTQAFGSPIFYGLILGLVYGKVGTGLAIGATIQLIYIGLVFTGGNMPSDQSLAGIISIPIALQTGMDVNVAVGLAVPFGVLGIFIDQIRRLSNSYWISKAEKYANEMNVKKIFHCAITYPTIVMFLITFTPVFVITLFGANTVQFVIDTLPQGIIDGLSVAGGVLPALGFAIIIMMIGKRSLMPYFFLGFFAVAYLGINTMAAAVFGFCIAALVLFNSLRDEEKVVG
ncbi:PTS mannose/fructose/sorbose/N-acetylgalactosamine transporter subunit IIC [Oceanobacillus neutriphilus]|uniref:PTS sorbose transporter subunit IIC n=1 Tax=Oceanobacillus neutriphilus TaxID=531815 RepID=A0ABQ2NT30_9BACI|nr:PTS sugar transporter subunit IIC [Oceanobacillus neutriphilus]GGP10198.1 PTS sorbose transporter subunit IIC [Oceanobacillus neutriphilus]